MKVTAGDIVHFTQEDGNRLKIFIGVDGITIDTNRLGTELAACLSANESLNVKAIEKKGT